MTKLSVITINYNNEKGLERTIQSVVGQRFRDLEFIVVDGGSSDGSVDVIKANAEKITKWVSEKDKGIYNAQNKGVAMAEGEYCLFLNSGDRLADEEVLQKVFSRGLSEDILYGDLIVDWGKGKITHRKANKKMGLYEMFTDTVWHPSAFIRRSLFGRHGNYDESFQLVADYDFFFRLIIRKKVPTRYLGFPISVFSHDGASARPENTEKLKAEKRRVWQQYLSDEDIRTLEEKQNKRNRSIFYRIKNKLR